MSRAKSYPRLCAIAITQWEQGKSTFFDGRAGVTIRCSFTEFRAEEDIFTLQLSLLPNPSKASTTPSYHFFGMLLSWLRTQLGFKNRR